MSHQPPFMEAETVLDLFDSKWFHLGILETRPKTSTSSPTPPPLQSDQKVSRQISFLARSKSDELSSFTTQNYSPDSVLIRPHLQTILSDKELSESPVVKKGVRRYERRKKRLSKSLSELEFEEVKGFVDIGFVFSEEDKEDPDLVEIIPGLQKLGKKAEARERERRRTEEASRMRARPYLSEAWEFYDCEKERRALMNMKWRVPLPPAATNEMDIKDSLKSWAHTVASAVR